MRVKLERITNGVALRTSEVVGHTWDLPRVGEKFLMTAPPLDPEAGNVRLVNTSPVLATLQSNFIDEEPWEVIFKTENSLYRVTRMAEQS